MLREKPSSIDGGLSRGKSKMTRSHNSGFNLVNSRQDWEARGLELALPFNLALWLNAPQIDTAVRECLRWISIPKAQAGHAKLNSKLLKVILLNLFHVYRTDPAYFCSYSRSKNDYALPKRYNHNRVSFKVVQIIDAMANAPEHPLIENYRGIWEDSFKRWARMRLTPFGAKFLFKDTGAIQVLASAIRNQESIVLREKDTDSGEQRDIEYTDTKQTIAMRKQVDTYNRLIARTPLIVRGFPRGGVPKASDDFEQEGSNYLIDYSRNQVRRIFSNGKWTEGGRFYSAWWINLPKEWRPLIYIDGSPTIEHDYSAIHPAIAYALEGLDIFDLPGGDPYHLDFYASYPGMRAVAKRLFNMALNANGRRSAISAFNNLVTKNHDDYGWFRKAGLKAGKVLDQLCEKHRPIKSWIHSGKGPRLQYIDSEIATEVLQRLTRQKIPVLPVHDSFVCKAQDSDKVKAEMLSSFGAVINRCTKSSLRPVPGIKSEGVSGEEYSIFIECKKHLQLSDFDSLIEMTGATRNPSVLKFNEQEIRLEFEKNASR